eukprot:2428242-Pyramimonas_sp.AAC.1
MSPGTGGDPNNPFPTATFKRKSLGPRFCLCCRDFVPGLEARRAGGGGGSVISEGHAAAGQACQRRRPCRRGEQKQQRSSEGGEKGQ